MKVLYNPSYDGFVYFDFSKNCIAFDTIVCNTKSLVNLIELHAGIYSPLASDLDRTLDYYNALKAYTKANSNDALWMTSMLKSDVRDKVGELKAILGYTKQPIVDFLKRHSSAKHRAFFMHIARRLWPKAYLKDLHDTDLIICVPAFVLGELTAAFEIGFLIYLPFITIDLVVSNILLAMGMMMVSPMTISLPFKLMLFVLVNGWDKLIEALALTYR